MLTELYALAFGAVLLVVHVLVAVHFKTKQFGIEWNLSSREEAPGEPGPLVGRLERARDNFKETFPVAIVAFGGLVLAGKTNDATAIAAIIWLGARILYLGIYWAGIDKIRTLVWMVSLLALLYAIVALIV